MKPRRRYLLLLASLLTLIFLADQWRRMRREQSQDDNILAATRRYAVDPALVKAVIWRESRFDPLAKGGKGEIGLMQIMPGSTGKDWAAGQRMTNYSQSTLFDSRTNIDCGTWYLRKLIRRYPNTDDPVPYALADYNAGRTHVLKWMTGAAETNSAAFIAQIRFPTTRKYVKAIIKRRTQYMEWAQTQRAKAASQ